MNISQVSQMTGTHVYNADTDEGKEIISTLYIKKSAFGEEIAPININVTIDKVEA